MFSVRQHERNLVILNKRIITKLRAKRVPALRVEAIKGSLVVARYSFRTTKIVPRAWIDPFIDSTGMKKLVLTGPG